MNLENNLMDGKVKRIIPNKIRASSIFRSSIQAIKTAKTMETLKEAIIEILNLLKN